MVTPQKAITMNIKSKTMVGENPTIIFVSIRGGVLNEKKGIKKSSI